MYYGLFSGTNFVNRCDKPVTNALKQNKKKTAQTGSLYMSGKRDSNPRPSAWEANALPTELFPQKLVPQR